MVNQAHESTTASTSLRILKIRSSVLRMEARPQSAQGCKAWVACRAVATITYRQHKSAVSSFAGLRRR